jgi:hypothetical protein
MDCKYKPKYNLKSSGLGSDLDLGLDLDSDSDCSFEALNEVKVSENTFTRLYNSQFIDSAGNRTIVITDGERRLTCICKNVIYVGSAGSDAGSDAGAPGSEYSD